MLSFIRGIFIISISQLLMSCGTISIPLQSFTTAFNEPVDNADMIITGSIEDDKPVTEDTSIHTASENSNDNDKHKIVHASLSETITTQNKTSSEMPSNHEDQFPSTASFPHQEKKPCRFPTDLNMVQTMSAYHPIQPCHDKKTWMIQKAPSPTDLSTIPRK